MQERALKKWKTARRHGFFSIPLRPIMTRTTTDFMDNGIRNLVFDFGGVLIDIDPRRCVEEFEKLGYVRQGEVTNDTYRKVDILFLEKDGYVVELVSPNAPDSVVSGLKFRDYVQKFIFEPLDMVDSGYHLNEKTRKKMAVQYRFVPCGGAISDSVEAQESGNAREGVFQDAGEDNEFILGEDYDSGGAGIISTVPDYAKLTAALANYGTGLTGERILSRHAVDLMRTDQLTRKQKEGHMWSHLAGCGYGLGVRTHVNQAESGVMSSLGEFGWGGAAGSTVIVDPSINLGVFYAQHTLNPREAYYQPRLRNVVYSCL